MDLGQLTSLFAALGSAACLFAGWRLLAAGRLEANDADGPQRGGDISYGLFFIALGVLMLGAGSLMFASAWRGREPAVFPIHILDLQRPPAAIESAKPPARASPVDESR